MTAQTPNTINQNLWIGSDGGSTYLDGYLDEFRISKGIARWTANFSPPDAPYSGNTNPYTPTLDNYNT